MGILSKLIEANAAKKVRIAVVGDCMVDEYYKVSVKRISPEAPVPVMLSATDQPLRVLPGGAANVAYQLKHWNVDCMLFGLLSLADERVYEKVGLKLPGQCWPTPTLSHVPRKKRFQDGQSLIRWDVEQEYSPEIELSERVEELIGCLEHYLKNYRFDLVILADYDKGIFKDFQQTQKIITLCYSQGVPTLVDPKNEPLEKWSGCTYFKPNSVEAERFTRVKDARHQCQLLAERLGSSNIVITRGGDGAIGLQYNKEAKVPPFNRYDDESFEVKSAKNVVVQNFSGAGDCFAAFMGLATAHGFKTSEAAEIAFAAGAKYVQANFNRPIYPLDLYENKFINPADLANRDFKLVVTNGCYDILTAAHVATFEFAKSKGDKLVVLINADESIRRLKGDKRPIVPLEQRIKVVAALECVDYVIAFYEDTPYNMISVIKPDVLVKGGDWAGKMPKSSDIVPEMCFAPVVEGVSTTNIINKIIQGEKNG